MTPSYLSVNRLIVIASSGEEAYNQTFKKGVNIIRGDNSSGKSTITNFIFFILGGDFQDFVPEAKRCSEVFAEVTFNAAIVTLRRAIELDENNKVKTKMPMFFYWGTYDQARNPPPGTNWQKFGYNSYPETKSFSNVIFDNLGIPIVKGDSNITIHQLLRLMYIDQESPTSSLFYYEQFDSQITRETTSELLLGIYNDDLYQNRRRLHEITKEIENIKTEIRTTKGFFSDPLTLNPANIEIKIETAQRQISQIETEIVNLKLSSNGRTLRSNEFRFQQLSDAITKQRQNVGKIKDEYNSINHEIVDNEFFIETLNEKLRSLKNSLSTREFLHNFPLHYCPECLTEIKEEKTNAETCKLCKEVIDRSYGITQGRRMEQEISFQINESTSLQKSMKEASELFKIRLKREAGKLQDLQKQFDREVKDVNTSTQEVIQNLYVEKGFLEGEILQFRTMLEQAQYYTGLLSQRDELIRERDRVEDFIKYAEQNQNELKEKVDLQIKKEALYLLNNDLHRQDEFKNANDFQIDYSNNIAFLASKYAKYSASSNFYLKITARFAIFLASLSIPEMRYPRFILADNMEDKGIELERAQNFQKILIARLKDFNPESYQVIFTTSYITQELNTSDLVVGSYYTADNRTLKNI